MFMKFSFQHSDQYFCCMETTFIDTHTHLYDEQFAEDRTQVILESIAAGVSKHFLPNCDSGTIGPMLEVCKAFPENCFPMMGLHPCSVGSNYKDELKKIETYLFKDKFYAVGEIGIDLYWDKTFKEEQELAFKQQIDWAVELNLPVVIHSRNSFDEIYNILSTYNKSVKGIFHCFSGNIEQGLKIIDLGLYLGIGGVVTFKNSGLDQVVKEIDLKHIVLETDSPYLAPTPFRGKRNKSSYIPLIAQRIADIKELPIERVAEITTKNAFSIFNI